MNHLQNDQVFSLESFVCLLLLVSVSCCEPALTQIQPDTTLGTERSTILPQGDSSNTSSGNLITGGVRKDSNLFHSFEQFNVGDGQSLYFNNPDGITRIFSRVTGSQLSKILGTLGAWDNDRMQIGNADLFLINPNGIFFGQNARLNLGGSFLASTASSIVFADGIEFSATNPSSPPLLTVDIPIGLRFGTRVGSIRNQSQRLEGGINRTLALVGGEVILEEKSVIVPGLGTGGGRVELGGVGSGEQVSLRSVEQGWALDYETVQTFADLTLLPDSKISFGSPMESLEMGRGEIHLQGKNVIFNAAQVLAFSNKNKPAKISIYSSELLELKGREGVLGSAIGVTSLSFEADRAGDIEIVAKNLRLSDSSLIQTETFLDSRVPGGNITITVARSVQLTDDSKISASTLGSGRAGDINIKTGELQIVNRAFIEASTRGEGRGGNIFITTGRLDVRDGGEISVAATEGSTGAAGNLNIRASSVRLGNFGTLSAETTSGEGNILLQVNNDLVLRTHSKITTNATGNASGGNITINTGVLAALENSDITANSRESSGGRVRITTQGIFGTDFRTNQTPESDITATSARGREFNGIVELNTPEIDPSRGLIRLPELVINPTTLITQNICKQGRGSELNRTGRGGLPPSVNQDLSNGATQINLVEPVTTQNNSTEENKSSNIDSESIEPAQGWIFNEKGEVVLTAYNPNITEPQRLRDNSTNCSAP